MANKWAVTRQMYWGSEKPYAVEIAGGGLDYTNPDALAAKYKGEFREFTDPREAYKTAQSIADAWRKDEPDLHIYIAVGHTGGFTMPFEEGTDEAAKAWADHAWSELPKCPRCGKPKGDEDWKPTEFEIPEGEGCCSESCANYHFAYLYADDDGEEVEA